jgi:hypothetical protein
MKLPAKLLRHSRISLRALLMAVTLSSIALGILAHRATRQRDLVRSLAGGSGSVFYDFQIATDGRLAPERTSPLPTWLVDALGVDLLHHVVWMRLDGPRVNDEILAAAVRLPRLESLHIRSTSVTENGLAKLERLQSLRVLTLSTPEVGDELVARLARLPALRELEVFSALVTDDGLRKLSDCQSLERVWFEDTDITEAGLDRFRGHHPHCRAGYSSPGFKTVAWRPRSMVAGEEN